MAKIRRARSIWTGKKRVAVVSNKEAGRIDTWNNIKAIFFLVFLIVLVVLGMKGWNIIQDFLN